MAQKVKEETFEEAFEKLANYSNILKDGNISLNEALNAFDEGIKYYEICNKILNTAKQKIEIYTEV